jgi:hypothetical protein
MADDPVFYGKPLVFKEKAHRYYWGGEAVPSVTTIINRLNKPLLIQWAANCAVDYIIENFDVAHNNTIGLKPAIAEAARKAHTVIRDTAGDIGHEVHEHARRHFMRMKFPALPLLPEPEHPQAVKALAAFRDWAAQHKIEPLGVERRVFSQQRMYAGTCDFYGRIDERLTIADFKTGRAVYAEGWFQMGGYEDALREELGLSEALDHVLIHLDKNTGRCVPHLCKADDTEPSLNVWRALVHLDKHMRAMPKTLPSDAWQGTAAQRSA